MTFFISFEELWLTKLSIVELNAYNILTSIHHQHQLQSSVLSCCHPPPPTTLSSALPDTLVDTLKFSRFSLYLIVSMLLSLLWMYSFSTLLQPQDSQNDCFPLLVHVPSFLHFLIFFPLPWFLFFSMLVYPVFWVKGDLDRTLYYIIISIYFIYHR